MYLLLFSKITFNTLDPQCLGTPYISKRNFSHQIIFGVFIICFDTLIKAYCHFIIHFFHLLIFHCPWCCFNVFLVLTKLRSFPNQIFHQFEFLLRMFKFEIVCQIDIPLKSGPSNNHNDLKAQIFFETLNRSSFFFFF